MVAAMGALLGMQTSDAPIEGELIEMTRVLISTTRGEFEGFCAERGVDSVVSFEPSDHERVTCAWLDPASDRVWHAAVHFDGASPQPVKADAGLVEAANARLVRLVHNEYGAQDARTGEGFPVWDVDLDGVSGRLTVAPFEDITVVRIVRTKEPAVLSMR